MTRAERRERWEGYFAPGRLALAGVLLSAELFFQPGLVPRLALLILAAAAAWLSGRRLSFPATALTMSGIVIANLLVPLGRRLGALGPLVVTELALIEGLEKALTFEALMLVSKATIGPGLRLPGRLGAFLSEALRYYDRILERRPRVSREGLIKSIDEILVSVYDGVEAATAEPLARSPESRRRALGPGDLVLAVAVVGFALPLALA